MNPSDYERRAARRRALQKKRRRQVMMMKGIILAILLVILALSCTAAWRIFSPSGDAGKNSKDKNLTASADTEAPEKKFLRGDGNGIRDFSRCFGGTSETGPAYGCRLRLRRSHCTFEKYSIL